MRSIKALITLILLGVVFSNTPAGVATAKIMNSTNEPTIDEFVDLILAEKITVPEVDAFLKGLNETQYEEFVKVFAERVGVDKKELQEEADEYNQITSPDKSLPGENPRTAAPNAVWNDTIENTWTISVNGPFREAETLIHPLVCSPPLGAATPTGRWNTEGMSISFRFP
jgi:hypothetical protein